MWVPAHPSSLHFQHCSTLDKPVALQRAVPVCPCSLPACHRDQGRCSGRGTGRQQSHRQSRGCSEPPGTGWYKPGVLCRTQGAANLASVWGSSLCSLTSLGARGSCGHGAAPCAVRCPCRAGPGGRQEPCPHAAPCWSFRWAGSSSVLLQHLCRLQSELILEEQKSGAISNLLREEFIKSRQQLHCTQSAGLLADCQALCAVGLHEPRLNGICVPAALLTARSSHKALANN